MGDKRRVGGADREAQRKATATAMAMAMAHFAICRRGERKEKELLVIACYYKLMLVGCQPTANG